VIAYENRIKISGVGSDIGRGNMAVRLDTPFSQIEGKVGTRRSTCCARSL
jgi:tRNA-splicing ligase RtcB